jgi:hypothetical protein
MEAQTMKVEATAVIEHGTVLDQERVKKALQNMKTVLYAMTTDAERRIKELKELKKKK